MKRIIPRVIVDHDNTLYMEALAFDILYPKFPEEDGVYTYEYDSHFSSEIWKKIGEIPEDRSTCYKPHKQTYQNVSDIWGPDAQLHKTYRWNFSTEDYELVETRIEGGW